MSTAIIMGERLNVTFLVDEDTCFGCGACIALCPKNALSLSNRLAVVQQDECTHCEYCIPSCPVFALSIEGD
ncbi:MAG: ferredoxin [Euryarchaeota archaeon]|nr:ferredoxin [Euryarchaeota archaeon]|tara:strand:- start:3775 stop:3990 length:216 start_codon:yes stop_codon:yes gene_type:complete